MSPLFTTRCLHVCHDVRDPSCVSGNCGRECCPVILPTSTPFRDLLRAANLRHGTDGFAFPPKEGVLRIFSLLKIRRLRPGLNPRTWVLKASTPPLDHRNRPLTYVILKIVYKEFLGKVYWFRRDYGLNAVAHLLFGPSTSCSRYLLVHVMTARDCCTDKAVV